MGGCFQREQRTDQPSLSLVMTFHWLVRLSHILETRVLERTGKRGFSTGDRVRTSTQGEFVGDGRLVRGSRTLFPLAALWSQCVSVLTDSSVRAVFF